MFRKFYFRGIDLDQLLGLSKKDLMDMLNARQRRRLSARGLQPKTQALINKLRKAKKVRGYIFFICSRCLSHCPLCLCRTRPPARSPRP